MDLNLLGVFDAIYHERSITRAARRLGVTQPAVSGALNRLRQLLDDPLFVKTTQGMEPTARADALAGPVSAALEGILAALNERVEFDYGRAEHTFCLAMSDYSEFLMLPPLIQWLREHARHISLRTVPVVEDRLAGQLESGEVDLAIGSIPSLQTGCFRQRLVFEDFVCVVRNGHPEVADALSVEQFQRIPQVIFTPRKDEATVDDLLGAQGLSRTIALRIPNYLAIMAIVSSSDLVGVLPQRIAARLCGMANLRALKAPVPYPGVSVNQHWHVAKNNHPANRWLRSLLRELTASL